MFRFDILDPPGTTTHPVQLLWLAGFSCVWFAYIQLSPIQPTRLLYSICIALAVAHFFAIAIPVLKLLC